MSIKQLIYVWTFAIVFTTATTAVAFLIRGGQQKSIVRQQGTHMHLDLSMSDPRVERRVVYEIDVPLPLGVTLEEMDMLDPSYGVAIVGISPEGNTARSNANVFSNIKSLYKDAVRDKCICIRDKIISINGDPCHDKSFDYVVGLILDLMSNVDTSTIKLEIGRIEGSTVVNYDNGLCISAKPGENYGFLARNCNVDIDYQCRSGYCQTCMKVLEFPNKQNEEETSDDNRGSATIINRRTIFHCIGKVPRGYEWLHVLTGNNEAKGHEGMGTEQ